MPGLRQARTPRKNGRAGAPDGLPNSVHVYRQLRERIINGEVPPDSRLIELTIAAEFGVSRTPVREALKRLAAEDLVRADPTRGMVVHVPDATEIDDVFVMRESLDGLAARLAAQRIRPSELARLRLIVESMREALADGRREHVLIANQRFHDIVYGAAGNMALARVAGQLRDFMRRFSTLPFASPDRVEHVWQEHEAILEALENHDPDAASAASIAHLEAAREYLIRLDLKEFAATGLR